jgi:hypothetical protein
LLVLGIAFTLPVVQTKLANYLTGRINKDYGTNIAIDEVAISVFGGVKLKKVLILDHHKDTLIYSGIIKTTIFDGKKLLDGDLIFSTIRLNELLFNLKTYKKEKKTNLDVFIEAFGTSSKPSKKHFLLKADKVKISNSHFILTDENREIPKDVDFTYLNVSLRAFKIYGPEVNTTIDKMSFKDHRGIFVKNLSSEFSYTKKRIKIEQLDLLTSQSYLKGDVYLNYKISDFTDFNNKVKFDIRLKTASLSSNDIRCFYKELGKNQIFYTEGRIKGPLNSLMVTHLKLVDSKKSKIIGTIYLKNSFGKLHERFYMNGKFEKIATTYDDLVTLLPNVLGKKLPTSLTKLGEFTVVGNTQVTASTVNANFSMITALGKGRSNFKMKNLDVSSKAAYVGNVVLEDFDAGSLFERKDLGKISLNVDVDGKGFSEKYLNTAIEGDVSQIDYNNYKYSNVSVNGKFKMPLYEGKVAVDDPNLKMTFDGLVDLSGKDSKYDFHANVENADLHQLKFVKDPISLFRGDVVAQVSGNSIENLQGNVFIKQLSYKNVKGAYSFEDFAVNSSFDLNKVRTITLNSPDIVEGEIVGKFQFDQLNNLVSNSLGSLYTNFKPSKVNKGQFLKFNFAIYNKIIEIFYPEISIGSNTVMKGNITSDSKEFKFNFNSPKITAYNNSFDNIRVAIDNKNPLYNTFVELDSIKTKYYKIRDFSLINVTMKDTLFFRSEFKGGSKGEDYFNLNLYHTINKENKNVVGINKSEIKLKDYLWFLNEKATPDNKIVFDKSFKNFNFDDIIMSHKNQEILFAGTLKDSTYKDLRLRFKDVDLNQITPANNKFVFNGNVNGEAKFKQDNLVYQLPLSIRIDHLNMNKIDLGDLNLDIQGDESFKKFTVKSVLKNENMEPFKVDGSLEFINKEPILDLKVKLNKFNLGVLNPLGGEVVSNIRGFVSGNSTIVGKLDQPEIGGRLYADKAGLTIPYLNVDYQLNDKTIIDLTDQRFLFRNNTLTDTKYGTKGMLNGNVEHNNFSDWKLDLTINSKKFLALDTKDHEDAAYYGVAFINGSATVKGPTNGLFIKVDAKSEKGTAVKIPINDSESVSENSFIHFLSEKEKYNIKKGIVDNSRKYKGLELEFEFNITPDAEVEVILDRKSGHGMKGKGNGTLLFEINTLGKFNMWGDFLPYEGTYNFKYKGLIDKKFEVKKGGSIEWFGDPMKAVLNLEAVYKTSANPAVLLENSSFNKKVPVEVVIGLRGDLASPEPDFTIDFPSVNNVLKSEIQYKLSDKDIRETQALYLLSSGGFLSAEGVSQSDLSGSIFETATNLLGGIIQSENDKFKVGVNIISADKRLGRETDGRFVTSFSYKTNERITINGKLGVPFGGINESAIVGDVEVQYRVNEDGTFNLRLFNRENDINYIGQGIGYTQGAGVSYEVDFDTFRQLLNKLFKKQKIDRVKKKKAVDQDSSLAPEDIRFLKTKKPNPEKSKVNQEARIPEEY